MLRRFPFPRRRGDLPPGKLYSSPGEGCRVSDGVVLLRLTTLALRATPPREGNCLLPLIILWGRFAKRRFGLVAMIVVRLILLGFL